MLIAPRRTSGNDQPKQIGRLSAEAEHQAALGLAPDLPPLAIFGRVAQLWQTVSRSVDEWLAPHGLNRGEFDE